MLEFLRSIFDNRFIPHGYCLAWSPDILWTHVIADALTALSYFLIPFALVTIIRRRRDLIFDRVFVLFSLFILLCGLTHVAAIIVLWNPVYRLEGMVKLATALVSLPTAIVALRLVPKAIAIPSLRRYQEIAEELQVANQTLEQRVADRTAELENATRQYRVLSEAVPQIVWTADASGELTYVNQRWIDHTGLSLERTQRGGWMESVHPDDRHRTRHAWVTALGTTDPYEHEFRLFNAASNTYRWHLARAVPQLNEAGKVHQWIGAITDINERKSAEQERECLLAEVEKSRAVLDAMFENAPVGFAFWDRELRFVRVNEVLAQSNGASQEDHVGRSLAEMVPDMEHELARMISRVFETGAAISEVELEGETPAHPGESRRWLCSYFPVTVKGNVALVAGVYRDITVRARAQAALRESEHAFRTLAETLPQMVWSNRADGFHDYFNARWLDYTGVSREEASEGDWALPIHPNDRDRARNLWSQCLLSGVPYEIEYRLRHAATGRYRWFLSRATPLHSEEGRIVRWFGTCTEIDDQKRNAEALERLNSDLEHFAYAASHDLQEPMRTILLYGQLIQQRHRTSLSPQVLTSLDAMTSAATRMSNLLGDLRTFLQSGRPPGQILEPIDPRAVLNEVVANLTAAIHESKAVITQGDLPKLRMDHYHLLQLLQNLISNAIKYRGNRPAEVRIGMEVQGHEYVFFVQDHGEGIEPEYHQKIFAAFQRLHGQSLAGSGLGLAICSRVVENYGGRIWVESERGRGSKFYFTLPEAILAVEA